MSESIVPPPNPEIEELLKEYNRREEEDRIPISDRVPKKSSGMAISLMNHSKGAIKTEKQANSVLVFFIIICLMVATFLFSRMSSYSEEVPPAFINKPHLLLR